MKNFIKETIKTVVKATIETFAVESARLIATKIFGKEDEEADEEDDKEETE